MTIELNRRPEPARELAVAVALGGRVLATATVEADDRVARLTLDLAGANTGAHHEELLWSPERPVLLDAGVAIGDDVVSSYLGLREVTVGADALRLNGRRFPLRSVLEQGYWPASHLTPPSPDALRDEVELILALGFNSARVHQKVEDPRFHFWADRLGLTLWGETAAAYVFDSLAVARLTREWVDIVRAYESHPSVIAWVVSAGWLNFVGPLVVWALFRDRSPFVRRAAAGSFNFTLSMTIAGILGWVMVFTIILLPLGILLIALSGVAAVVLGIMGALRTWRGETFAYPWQVRVLS